MIQSHALGSRTMMDPAVLLPKWRMRVADFRGRGVYAGYPNRHRCIFIHVPKTAGSSVAQILFGEASRHVPYSEYRLANPRKFKSYFKFAFVRNPLDRLVSTYFFLRDGGMNEQDRVWSQQHLSCYPDFPSFVRGWVNDKNIRSWVHFRPQSYFLLDDTGALMVDYLGRFERLEHDFEQVARRLGFDCRLPRTNKSSHSHFGSYYDDETCEIARHVYRTDVECFGYDFDLRTLQI